MANNKYAVYNFTGMGGATWTPVTGVLPQGLAMRVHIFNGDGSASLTVATSTVGAAGTVIGTEVGPYIITASTNDAFKIAVDGGLAQTITFTAGILSTQQIVDAINAQSTGVTALVESGRVRITSNTVGASSSVAVQSVTHDAYTTLGFTAGTYSGSAVAAITVLKGTEYVIQISPNRPGFAYGEVICYVQGSGSQPIITQEG